MEGEELVGEPFGGMDFEFGCGVKLTWVLGRFLI